MQASLEDEAKRVTPAITNRKQLLQRDWDGVPATAAAFGLKGEAGLFNAVVRSAEKGCRGPVTLQSLRRLKARYEVPGAGEGEGRVAKTAVMSTMTHVDPEYDVFMDAVCEQAVTWLHEAQKDLARSKGLAQPAQVDFTQPALWGRSGGTKAAFKGAMLKFLEQALDSTLQASLQAEVTEALKVHTAYLAHEEKKKNTAMDHDVLSGLVKGLEKAHDVHLHLWAVPSKIDMGRLKTVVEAMQMPTDPKTEPENLKPFADKEGRIRPEDKTETWEFSEQGGPRQIVESRDKVKEGAAGSVQEECEGVRLLLTGLLLLGHNTTVEVAKVPADRGGGKKLITPTQVYCFLEMFHVSAHMFPSGSHGAKQLYTIRAEVFRKMRDMVNTMPFATYDYALREGRALLWQRVVELQATKALLFNEDAAPKTDAITQPGGVELDAKKETKAKSASGPAPTASGTATSSGKATAQVEKLEEEMKKKKARIAELEKALSERNAQIKTKDAEIRQLKSDLSQCRSRAGGERRGDRRRSRSPSRDDHRRKRR